MSSLSKSQSERILLYRIAAIKRQKGRVWFCFNLPGVHTYWNIRRLKNDIRDPITLDALQSTLITYYQNLKLMQVNMVLTHLGFNFDSALEDDELKENIDKLVIMIQCFHDLEELKVDGSINMVGDGGFNGPSSSPNAALRQQWNNLIDSFDGYAANLNIEMGGKSFKEIAVIVDEYHQSEAISISPCEFRTLVTRLTIKYNLSASSSNQLGVDTPLLSS